MVLARSFPTTLRAMPPPTALPRLDPPQRLLAGPGPSNVEPAVLAAMQKPMLGHLDPDLHEILAELVDFQRAVYGARAASSFRAPGDRAPPAWSAALSNLLEPGDTAIVAVTGFFGNRIARDGRAHGREGRRGPRPDYGQIAAERERCSTRSTPTPTPGSSAVVHAETSTGVRAPGRGARRASCSAAAATRCCSSTASPRSAPIRSSSTSGASTTRTRARRRRSPRLPACRRSRSPTARSSASPRARQPVPFTFDLDLLAQVLGRPADHLPPHRADPPHLRAARGAARRPRGGPRRSASSATRTPAPTSRPQLRSRGLELLADPEYQLAQLTAVRVPDGVDGKEVQGRVLKEHDIEIGGGLGPDAPAIWRLGLMGHNARREAADQVLGRARRGPGRHEAPRTDRLTAERRIRARATRPPGRGRGATRVDVMPDGREASPRGRIRRTTRGATTPARRVLPDEPGSRTTDDGIRCAAARAQRARRPRPRTPDSVPRSAGVRRWTTGDRSWRRPSSACARSYRTIGANAPTRAACGTASHQ